MNPNCASCGKLLPPDQDYEEEGSFCARCVRKVMRNITNPESRTIWNPLIRRRRDGLHIVDSENDRDDVIWRG